MRLQYISLFLNIPLLLIGFFLLNRGAGMLVDGTSSLARRINIPETMVSFAVVAFGTSLPKLFTVLLAAYNGYADLAIGTIIGSCIFNFLGILSITGLSRPIRANKYTATIGIFFLVAGCMVLLLLANLRTFSSDADAMAISRKEAVVLLFCFVAFMVYGYFNIRKHRAIWYIEDTEKPSQYAVWFSIVLAITGLLGLIAGGVLAIDNLIDISRKFDLSQRFLGQFILSLGGSFVMLYWVRTTQFNVQKFEVSNLIGQNIFNLLGMTGISACLQPVIYNRSFNLDLFILAAIGLLIAGMLWMGRKLTLNVRKCRFLLFLLLLYMAYLFAREKYQV
jgi:cation:H+ antiporter